eukprot:TRINITY_DN4729_c0_g1_i1.p1 TRINITY_DN4729_c0_g1~~TRINITY_DN4729_c0_g1_i1.p1  ORF type:complete len:360 (+),score=23.98 TRINITY_DN4729_c0_g1_i1:75-1082(+)
MSSAGMPTGATAVAAPPQLYFCYQCNRTVSITPSPTSDLACPTCNGGFLEEYENPNPNPNFDPFFPFSLSGGFPLMFSTSRSIDLQNPSDIAGIFGSDVRGHTSSGQDSDAFNPLVFLQNYLQTLISGGTNIQFVIENNSADPSFRIPANFGDYFIGPGLEQLIQQLAENDPNRYGNPPASKSAVESLPDIKISGELLDSDSAQCAVCKDTFEFGSIAKQMPCKHIYHSDCIFPWLALHNSCPVCRYELPTDDPDYESRNLGHESRNSAMQMPESPMTAATAAADPNSGGTMPSNSPGARRLRISLPWPLSAFGSQAETSNSRANDEETRYEDLD